MKKVIIVSLSLVAFVFGLFFIFSQSFNGEGMSYGGAGGLCGDCSCNLGGVGGIGGDGGFGGCSSCSCSLKK